MMSVPIEAIAGALAGGSMAGLGSVSRHDIPTAYGRLVRRDPVAVKIVCVAAARARSGTTRSAKQAAGRESGSRHIAERADDEIVVLAASMLRPHPNVLPLVQVCRATASEIAVCTPLAAGCVLDVMCCGPGAALPAGPPPPVSVARAWFSDMVWGLEHMVSRLGVVPLDVSIENVLVFLRDGTAAPAAWEGSVAVLADFGQVAARGAMASAGCGKPATRPPELGHRSPGSADAASVCAFQLGVVLFTLVTRVRPFTRAALRDPGFATLVLGTPSRAGLSARACADRAGAAPGALAYLSRDRTAGVRALAEAYGVSDRLTPAAAAVLAGLLDPDPATRTPLVPPGHTFEADGTLGPPPKRSCSSHRSTPDAPDALRDAASPSPVAQGATPVDCSPPEEAGGCAGP